MAHFSFLPDENTRKHIIISIIIHHRQLAALNCYSASQTQPCTDVLLQLPEVPEIAFGTY